MRQLTAIGLAVSTALLAAASVAAPPKARAPAEAPAPASYLSRLPQDEVVYFLLPDRFDNADPSNDRGGLTGDRLVTGFDPTSRAFYNGGDLKGVMRRLDYLQGMGVTAIWLGPIFKNKPVQGAPGHESAGYHGYWITDFTDVDPHFGSRADLKALVDAAHRRGLKVYLDIVVNHTADVIRYRECPEAPCPYRSRADYPYTRQGGPDGAPINAGFRGDDDQSAENFARLTRPDYAYTPFVPPAEAHLKRPDWLNDPIWYHNRGDSQWRGESAQLGDFSGLDDVFTENPRVVRGFIDIYGQWIKDFRVDGFRIDTAKHVNPEFWRAFVPAMQARARAAGIPHFHIFGEVYEPDVADLAAAQKRSGLPAVLDFPFQSAAVDVFAKDQGTDRLARLFAADLLFAGDAAAIDPVFLGNHDMGRFAMMLRQARPAMDEAEVLQRVALAYALAFFSRGQPVIYAGDEQGFVGTGGDQASRQSLFASRVAEYNAERLLGSSRTTAVDNFDPAHPLYRALRSFAAVRAADPALRRGTTVVRASSAGPGVFAFSRRLAGAKGETLVVFNTSTKPISMPILVEAGSQDWRTLAGTCAPHATAPGSYPVSVPPLSFAVCRSGQS